MRVRVRVRVRVKGEGEGEGEGEDEGEGEGGGRSLAWMMATWPCARTMEVLHWSLPEILARKKQACRHGLAGWRHGAAG